VTRFWYTLKNFDSVKCKTCHGKNEEKGEFGSFCNESLRFKCDTPIMFGPHEFVSNQNMANDALPSPGVNPLEGSPKR
jgi:hypothetical protein